jgi:hypothetical protein
LQLTDFLSNKANVASISSSLSWPNSNKRACGSGSSLFMRLGLSIGLTAPCATATPFEAGDAASAINNILLQRISSCVASCPSMRRAQLEQIESVVLRQSSCEPFDLHPLS